MKVDNVKNVYLIELDQMIEVSNMRIEKLKTEERIDEANFEKISNNIYDVFKTLYGASEKRIKGITSEVEKVAQFEKIYKAYFDTIPESWYENLEKAKAHDDFENVRVEEIKIETMKKIYERFSILWKEIA